MRPTAHTGSLLFNGSGRPLHLDRPAKTIPASMGGNATPIIDQEELSRTGPTRRSSSSPPSAARWGAVGRCAEPPSSHHGRRGCSPAGVPRWFPVRGPPCRAVPPSRQRRASAAREGSRRVCARGALRHAGDAGCLAPHRSDSVGDQRRGFRRRDVLPYSDYVPSGTSQGVCLTSVAVLVELRSSPPSNGCCSWACDRGAGSRARSTRL